MSRPRTSLVFLATIYLVASATYFEGPCPDVVSHLPSNVHKYPWITKLILFSSVNSQSNHLFYRDTPISYPSQVLVEWNGPTFAITKFNGGLPCQILDVLVPSKFQGSFKHEIHKGPSVIKSTNESCGTYWDQYQVMDFGRLLFLWGCVNFHNSSGHEEGLWVLIDKSIYQESVTGLFTDDVSKVFPVGLLTMKDMVGTIKEQDTRIKGEPVDCSRSLLLCKEVGAKKWTEDRQLLWPLFAIIVGVAFFIIKYMGENCNRECMN